MKTLLLAAALPFLFLATSVANPKDKAAPAATPKATCCVCRYNRDLGCVEFRLKPNTPRLTHEGREYCFCSEDCRQVFEKKPSRYVERK